jgi:hypothetical protein
MRTITTHTDVYSFSELPDKAKQYAIDNFRETYDYSFRQESILGWFTEILERMGISDPKISYTGFYSQGDGLSFTGQFRYNPKCLESIEGSLSDESILSDIKSIYSVLAEYDNQFRIDITHSGRYYHEYTMRFDFISDDYCLDNVLEEVEPIEHYFRSIAKRMYRLLEQDYNAQISDSAITEYLTYSDNEFTIEGKVFDHVN